MTDIQLGEVKMLLKAEKHDAALKSARVYFENFDDANSDEWTSINDVFEEFGYNVMTNETGDIIDLDVISSDLPNGQEAFFEVIAPFVESGSYIHLKREDKYWKFVFEKEKVKRLDSEIVFYDKPMTYDRAMCLLSEIVEHTCVARKTSEAIEHLFRLGFTDDELVDVFNFDKTDVDRVVSSIEEDA